MTHDEHRERHVLLHRNLDELLADFLRHNTQRLLSETDVWELVKWSHSQTIDPTERGKHLHPESVPTGV